MNHRDTEVTEAVIGAAIEVHRELGPGLLETVYEAALAHELALRDVSVKRQWPVSVQYKGIELPEAFRVDLLIEESVVVELKCVDSVLPIHDAQLLSYLKLMRLKTGLLINFKVPLLKLGIKRLSN